MTSMWKKSVGESSLSIIAMKTSTDLPFNQCLLVQNLTMQVRV
uniref:Uncharacterized protein n=1 Tax=Nelumbo nucifera TaxID=4432 RepID=A0A822Z340_NELNU|nr:TPA_asm: hypothetical protein HUJ06_013520 [Nelumbo nucifera]